jgi:hypothetical protein
MIRRLYPWVDQTYLFANTENERLPFRHTLLRYSLAHPRPSLHGGRQGKRDHLALERKRWLYFQASSE